MDLDYSNYHWESPGNNVPDESPLIDDLFFGMKGSTAWQEEKMPGKFWQDTMNEDPMSDESQEESVMDTEEVFEILDDVIQDWKIKLECVVGDGLKKLRKAGKEKKLMIKYLPGEHSGVEKKLGVPKATIMKDWKTDFTHIVTGIQKKLDRLTKDKVKEVDSLYCDKFLYTNTTVKEVEDLNKNKKEMVNIDSRDTKRNDGVSTYIGLKQLVRELNKMCEKVANSQYMMNDPNIVPIYDMANDNPRQNVVANTYETPLNRYLNQLMTLPPTNLPPKFETQYDPDVIAKNQANILDALDDFRVKQNTQNKILKMKMKDNWRDNNRVSAQRKMLQRKVNRKVTGIKGKQEKKPEVKYSFRMKHYNKDGKDHYLIVKKSDPIEKVEVEDIFADWRCTALDTIDDRKRQRTPRVRKISHRAQRKEMLRTDSTSEADGPKLYSEIVKKGLRFRPTNAPVEDIFEAWRDYLKELDDLLSSEPSSTQSSRHSSGYESNDEIKIQTAKEEKICESSENILETACGQPTVRRVPYDVTNERVKADVLKSFSIPVQVCGMPSKDDNRYLPQGGRTKKLDTKKKKRTMKYQPEIYFAGWRQNFHDESDWVGLPKQNKRLKYDTEEIFRGWKRNFYVRERCDLEEEVAIRRHRKHTLPKMMPEKIFNEWLHNFHFKSRRNSKYGSLKRRSSKKEKSPTQVDAKDDQEHDNKELDNTKSLKNKSRSNRQRRSKKNKNDF